MATKTRRAVHSNGTTAPEPVPDHPLARAKPRGDRVVVRRNIPKAQTEGGILLPDSVSSGDKEQVGVIWSVGPGTRQADGTYVPLDLEKGQRVIIAGYAGLEVRDRLGARRGDEFVLVRDEDVVAVLPDA